jgi:hypothetical protein
MDADDTAVDAANHWLETYDPTSDPPEADYPSGTFLSKVRKEMVRVTRGIIQQLYRSELGAFQQFWVDKRRVFMGEYQRRCEYNRGVHTGA